MKKTAAFIIFSITLITKISANASGFHPFPAQQPRYNQNYSTINNTPYNANPNYSYNKAQKKLYKQYLHDQQLLNQQYYNQNNLNKGFWQNIKNNFLPNGVVTGISPIIPTDNNLYNNNNHFYYYDGLNY